MDSYDVTIFPAESIKNSVSKKAKLKAEAEEDDKYSAWFFDLAGQIDSQILDAVIDFSDLCHSSNYKFTFNTQNCLLNT